MGRTWQKAPGGGPPPNRVVERQERDLGVPPPRAEAVPPPSKHAVKRYGMVDGAGRYVGPGAGSTAAVAVLRGDQLAVAHAGDSRCWGWLAVAGGAWGAWLWTCGCGCGGERGGRRAEG